MANFKSTKPMDNSYQRSERMKFWGVTCVGGKAYKQVVNSRFHLTMAVLDPKSFENEIRDRIVTLSVIHHGQVFLICVLKHGQIHQKSLNLIFDKGDDIIFTVGGYGTVHLTGYSLIDPSDSAFDSNTQNSCPVTEIRLEKQKHKSLVLPVNGVETKSKLKKAFIDNAEEDDEDEDEEDSDFCVKPEEFEEDESDEDFDEEEDEIDEEEIEAVLKECDEIVTPPKSEGSMKRKVAESSLSQKRRKKERFDSKSTEEDEEVCLTDDESISDKDDLNSSIGHTPMPKKLDTSAKAKKKLKKRKRLSEISNLDNSEKASNTPPQDKTPNKKGENKVRQPVVKLEDDVEYQDIVIGRGPVAAHGKLVSVFYIGRLENKAIFDARTAPKKPFTFRVGGSQVIKGFDIGIKGMKVGGQRKLKIPPKMGYGSKGAGDNVPPNSTLFFTIELINVN